MKKQLETRPWQLTHTPGDAGFNSAFAMLLRRNNLGSLNETMTCDAPRGEARQPHPYQRLLQICMGPKSPTKRLLVNWEVGTGKTQAMIQILDTYFDQASEKIILVPDGPQASALRANFVREIFATPNQYAENFTTVMDLALTGKVKHKSQLFSGLTEQYRAWRNAKQILGEMMDAMDKEHNWPPAELAKHDEKEKQLDKQLAELFDKYQKCSTFRTVLPFELQPPGPLWIMDYAQMMTRQHTYGTSDSTNPDLKRPYKIATKDALETVLGRCDNAIILCDEAHNLVCGPNGKLSETRRTVAACIAQGKDLVLGLFTATPMFRNILDYLQLMIICKGPTASELESVDYGGFDPARGLTNTLLTDSQLIDDMDSSEQAEQYATLLAAWRKVDRRNEEGFVSVFRERVTDVFAEVVPDYDNLNDDKLTTALVQHVPLGGEHLEEYIMSRFLHGQQVPLQWKDLQASKEFEYKPPHAGNALKIPFERVKNQYHIRDALLKVNVPSQMFVLKQRIMAELGIRVEDLEVFWTRAKQQIQARQDAWVDRYKLFQTVGGLNHRDFAMLTEQLNETMPEMKEIACTFKPSDELGWEQCVRNLQLLENVRSTTIPPWYADMLKLDTKLKQDWEADHLQVIDGQMALIDESLEEAYSAMELYKLRLNALSSKFHHLVTTLQQSTEKTIVLLHDENGFKLLEAMFHMNEISCMVLSNSTKGKVKKKGKVEKRGQFYNNAHESAGLMDPHLALSFFNQPENCQGDQVRVALLSANVYSEGVSFQEVRRIVLADLSEGTDEVSWATIVQRIGRGVRMCSHKRSRLPSCGGRAAQVKVTLLLSSLPGLAALEGTKFSGKLQGVHLNAVCKAQMVGQLTLEQAKWQKVVKSKQAYDYFMGVIYETSIEAAIKNIEDDLAEEIRVSNGFSWEEPGGDAAAIKNIEDDFAEEIRDPSKVGLIEHIRDRLELPPADMFGFLDTDDAAAKREKYNNFMALLKEELGTDEYIDAIDLISQNNFMALLKEELGTDEHIDAIDLIIRNDLG